MGVHLAPKGGDVVTLHREDGSRVRILRPATEDEVLAAFVEAERDSPRYGTTVRKLVDRVGDNSRAVLAAYRSWPDQGLFGGFPRDVRWFRAALTSNDVLEIRYINWDWWLRLSGGSRDPRDAAERIRAGLIEGVEDGPENQVIARNAARNPELIAVRAPESRLVLLEGHARLTAYALYPEHLPPELEVFVGESAHMVDWSEY
jgi:hypothetical protein